MRHMLHHPRPSRERAEVGRREQHESAVPDQREVAEGRQQTAAPREGVHHLPGLQAQVHLQPAGQAERAGGHVRERGEEGDGGQLHEGEVQHHPEVSEGESGRDDEEVPHPHRAAQRLSQPAIPDAADAVPDQHDHSHHRQSAQQSSVAGS